MAIEVVDAEETQEVELTYDELMQIVALVDNLVLERGEHALVHSDGRVTVQGRLLGRVPLRLVPELQEFIDRKGDEPN